MNGHQSEQKDGIAGAADRHVAVALMKRYVSNSLPDRERERVDLHLAECDICLQLLMEAVDSADDQGEGEASGHFPPLDLNRLEERVMAQLVEEEAKAITHHELDGIRQEPVSSAVKAVQPTPSRTTPPRRRTLLQHPVAQYTIAASVTLLLIGTGTFTDLSDKLLKLDRQAVVQPLPPAASESEALYTESWSDRMVDRTGAWLEGIRASRYK